MRPGKKNNWIKSGISWSSVPLAQQREQGLAPGARQALAVEVAGMKGPQAHAPILPARGNPGTWG